MTARGKAYKFYEIYGKQRLFVKDCIHGSKAEMAFGMVILTAECGSLSAAPGAQMKAKGKDGLFEKKDAFVKVKIDTLLACLQHDQYSTS